VTRCPCSPVDELADGKLHLPGLAPELPALRPGSGGPIETKRCPGCGQVKARSAFWRNARRSDSCATYCRDCGHMGSHKPPALLPTAPILRRLRVAVAGASYVGDPDYGVPGSPARWRPPSVGILRSFGCSSTGSFEAT
jgi:hypothetical protein